VSERMDEDTEYLKLPLEERMVHKLWKARVSGYEEAKKLFGQVSSISHPIYHAPVQGCGSGSLFSLQCGSGSTFHFNVVLDPTFYYL